MGRLDSIVKNFQRSPYGVWKEGLRCFRSLGIRTPMKGRVPAVNEMHCASALPGVTTRMRRVPGYKNVGMAAISPASGDRLKSDCNGRLTPSVQT